jgi:hypothetical protein
MEFTTTISLVQTLTIPIFNIRCVGFPFHGITFDNQSEATRTPKLK